MKKLLLISLCALTTVQTPLYSNENNSLDLVAAQYKTSFWDLSLKKKFISALGGVGGSAGTYIGAIALENLLHSKPRPVNFTDPVGTWNWPERLAAVAGCGFFAKMTSDHYKPETVAKKANQNGLLELVLASSSDDDLRNALDERFVSSHFPRAMAFDQLNELRNAIVHLLDLTAEYNTHKPHRSFKSVKTALARNLKRINAALILVKKDPRWHEECNAKTLKDAQAVQEARHNAELAGAVIDLAHRR